MLSPSTSLARLLPEVPRPTLFPSGVPGPDLAPGGIRRPTLGPGGSPARLLSAVPARLPAAERRPRPAGGGGATRGADVEAARRPGVPSVGPRLPARRPRASIPFCVPRAARPRAHSRPAPRGPAGGSRRGPAPRAPLCVDAPAGCARAIVRPRPRLRPGPRGPRPARPGPPADPERSAGRGRAGGARTWRRCPCTASAGSPTTLPAS